MAKDKILDDPHVVRMYTDRGKTKYKTISESNFCIAKKKRAKRKLLHQQAKKNPEIKKILKQTIIQVKKQRNVQNSK